MRLSPHEQERLLLSYAAELARRRQARGLKLNHPEAVALITDHVLEGARDGRSVAELMSSGRTVLTRDEVMAGVPGVLHHEPVKATFPEGTKRQTVHPPHGKERPVGKKRQAATRPARGGVDGKREGRRFL